MAKSPRIHVAAASMGYGHLRAAFPLTPWTAKGVVTINDYAGIPGSDARVWEGVESFYNFISKFKAIPVVGTPAFKIFDYLFQSIPKFDPKRMRTRPSIAALSNYDLIYRKGWGKDLVARLAKDPVPIVAPFFTAAFMAEAHGYPGPIFCLPTDTDLNRAWAPRFPAKSRIVYLAPTERAAARLKTYGVTAKNIVFTGFPLPEENIGHPSCSILKKDMALRLAALDPDGVFLAKRGRAVLKELGIRSLPKRTAPLSVMFAIGGAGAQRELGRDIVTGLAAAVKDGLIRLDLVAGVHAVVRDFFMDCLRKNGLSPFLGKGVRILYTRDKPSYFALFNRWLRTTDILWTKPSELSFYAGLGLPILIAPPLGCQEDFNKEWLLDLGAAIVQKPAKKAGKWMFEMVRKGDFAEAAWQGYLKAPRHGTPNVLETVRKRSGIRRG